MVKHLKVFVKTFSGANTTCMNRLRKSIGKEQSGSFYVGTNDLPSYYQSKTKSMALAYLTSQFEQTTKN